MGWFGSESRFILKPAVAHGGGLCVTQHAWQFGYETGVDVVHGMSKCQQLAFRRDGGAFINVCFPEFRNSYLGVEGGRLKLMNYSKDPCRFRLFILGKRSLGRGAWAPSFNGDLSYQSMKGHAIRVIFWHEATGTVLSFEDGILRLVSPYATDGYSNDYPPTGRPPAYNPKAGYVPEVPNQYYYDYSHAPELEHAVRRLDNPLLSQTIRRNPGSIWEAECVDSDLSSSQSWGLAAALAFPLVMLTSLGASSSGHQAHGHVVTGCFGTSSSRSTQDCSCCSPEVCCCLCLWCCCAPSAPREARYIDYDYYERQNSCCGRSNRYNYSSDSSYGAGTGLLAGWIARGAYENWEKDSHHHHHRHHRRHHRH